MSAPTKADFDRLVNVVEGLTKVVAGHDALWSALTDRGDSGGRVAAAGRPVAPEALTAAGLCSCGCGQPLSRDSDAYKAELERLTVGVA